LNLKYHRVPEGWAEQHQIYSEVSRSIYFCLTSSNLKVVYLALQLLKSLGEQAHRAQNRFLLEALTDDRLLRQLRVVWKAHHSKTGGYSMQITESVLEWVQHWRDELVPPSQRKRHDPANNTKWSWNALQSSVKSYSNMNTDQLKAAAASGAHWLDKRVKEASGVSKKDEGIFTGLENCHDKLKKRGAHFPDVLFGSSNNEDFDIQRCSESGDAAFAAKKHEQHEKKHESPTSTAVDVDDEFSDDKPSKLKVVVKPVSEDVFVADFANFSFAPPPGSPEQSAVQQSVVQPVQPATVVSAAPVDEFDFLDFSGAEPAPSPQQEMEMLDMFNGAPAGNPFDFEESSGNPFADNAPVAADPFAELALRPRVVA